MTSAHQTGGATAREVSACDHRLRRTDLVAASAGRLQYEFKRRTEPARVLGLRDEDLIEIVASREVADRDARFDPSRARQRASAAALRIVCRCTAAYPPRLRDLADPPAVLHVLGSVEALADPDGVAVV